MKVHFLYCWHAVDQQGIIRQGELMADSKPQAYQQLFAQNLQPYHMKAGKRISMRQWRGEPMIQFTRQLATLLQAGLPLVNSLQLLAQEHPSPAWRCLLTEINRRVVLGHPFSEVIAEWPSVFPLIYRQLIAIGELTGNLDRCCLQLAQQQETQQQLQKKVKKALSYPLFICLVAILVTLLMLIMVLPEFAKIYHSFDAPLPWFTQRLLNLSAFMSRTGPYLLLILTLAGWLYLRWLHPLASWQQREDAILLHLPLISSLVKGHSLSQIFHILAMTQQAGLTLVAGLNAAGLSINNVFYRQALKTIEQQLLQGHSFYQALAQQMLFPSLCQQLVSVGEKSGTLDLLLEKLAIWHEQQTKQLADTLAQTLEPLLMLIVGGIVGGLVIAMYLPIFQLGNVLS